VPATHVTGSVPVPAVVVSRGGQLAVHAEPLMLTGLVYVSAATPLALAHASAPYGFRLSASAALFATFTSHAEHPASAPSWSTEQHGHTWLNRHVWNMPDCATQGSPPRWTARRAATSILSIPLPHTDLRATLHAVPSTSRPK
jgi:hypothetical protein